MPYRLALASVGKAASVDRSGAGAAQDRPVVLGLGTFERTGVSSGFLHAVYPTGVSLIQSSQSKCVS